MVSEVVTWQAVALALVTGLPATIAAIAALKNGKQLRTGNDKTVGEMVTESHGALSTEHTTFPTHAPGPSTDYTPKP